jgi:hypothetical protein
LPAELETRDCHRKGEPEKKGEEPEESGLDVAHLISEQSGRRGPVTATDPKSQFPADEEQNEKREEDHPLG